MRPDADRCDVGQDAVLHYNKMLEARGAENYVVHYHLTRTTSWFVHNLRPGDYHGDYLPTYLPTYLPIYGRRLQDYFLIRVGPQVPTYYLPTQVKEVPT